MLSCPFTMALAYRPLHLLELGSLSSLPEHISKSIDHVAKVVRKCGSFVTIREGTVFFIHQSAKDYLLEDAYDKFFPTGSEECQYAILSQSLRVLSSALRRDIYRLKAPGISIDQVSDFFHHVVGLLITCPIERQLRQRDL